MTWLTRKVIFWLTWGLAWGATQLAFASTETKPVYYVPSIPSDMADLDFYLLTGGPGSEVNDRFGHTAIRVVNRAEGTDVAFNWGKYSFDDPGFLWKFFRGQLDYSMGVRTFERDVAIYSEMDRRVVMDRINLTDKQKRKLISKIAWNAAPEHRKFSYQYWYKNCATIPRDYLDEALGGQLHLRLAGAPAHRVFRDYVRRNLAYSPFIVPLLDVLMNGNIDRPITAWDDMFLPHNLRRWLRTMPSFDDAGNPVDGVQLLSGERVLLDHPEVFRARFNDFLALTLPMGASLITAVILLLAAPSRRRLAYRMLGVATLWWSAISGLFGTTLALNWAFSGHPDGWHNANLLLFWPLDWLFLGVGLELLRRGEAAHGRGLVRRFGRHLMATHVVGLGMLCALVGLGVIHQDVWQVVAWFGLPMIMLGVTLILWGLRAPATQATETVDATKGMGVALDLDENGKVLGV